MNLHERIARLERADAPGQREVRIMGGLPGAEPMSFAQIGGERFDREPDETERDFKRRLYRTARGRWIVWGGLS